MRSPVIEGWIEQWYASVPELLIVMALLVAPGAMLGVLKPHPSWAMA